jgi:tellurite resistance protein
VRELSEGRPPGFGFTASPKEVETETLAALQSAKGILAEKAPDEADSYAQHILGVMDAVAEAKGGVSDEESAAIDRIKGTLGS